MVIVKILEDNSPESVNIFLTMIVEIFFLIISATNPLAGMTHARNT